MNAAGDGESVRGYIAERLSFCMPCGWGNPSGPFLPPASHVCDLSDPTPFVGLSTDFAPEPERPRDCPRCGTAQVDILSFGSVQVAHVPACACFPHPPRCPSCRTALADGRCDHMDCSLYSVPIPLPITDPLWETA